MVLDSNPTRSRLCGALRLTLAALAATALGVACGGGANPPPIATVAPPAPVSPAATVAPAAAVAPAQVPASTFEFPPTRTPRPKPTPIPRAEGDITQAVLYHHTATLLEDGRVLVTGGQATGSESFQVEITRFPPNGVVTAEIYDPSTGRWSPTHPMFDARRHHGAILLDDGRILVSGGLTEEFTTHPADAYVDWVGSIGSAEVYDPSTETWSFVGNLPQETVRLIAWRYNRPAILLDIQEDGKVLAIGGLGPSAALYDPSSGTWASVAAPTAEGEYQERGWHTTALVENGKVLYIGGWSRSGNRQLDSVGLYDPLTGSVSPTNSIRGDRYQASSIDLADGRVLVTGGYRFDGNERLTLASAEIYDPSSLTWSGAEEMATGRVGHTMTALSDRKVLVVGGSLNRTTEIYDPSTNDWSEAANTIEPRERHTATLLDDGRVLVAGGASGSGRQPFPSTSAEVYDPVADTWTPSTEVAR